jgi:hypothetical protein
MRRGQLLVILTAVGSALCWLPNSMEPNLDLWWWLPLLFVALLAGTSTSLAHWRWLMFLVASVIGTFAGLCCGIAIWPSPDPIAQSYSGLVLLMGTGMCIVVSLIACLVGRRISIKSGKALLATYIVLGCCVAIGPVTMLLTPPLVAQRVARNDQLAAGRFAGLKNALERVQAESGGLDRTCDGQAIKRNYSGPPFTESDWDYIGGNYVKQDGYVFGIWCHQSEYGGYAIDVWPERQKADGTRKFCADESGRVGCNLAWDRTRNVCAPCGK